ncbi:MAG: hypothetical protein LBS92_07070 [Candidatus Methanoplasma sp.]|nr:hypothetical protein [Candidatus Methanoplasma sp.]
MILEKIIESAVFRYLIKTTSKPYSKGFRAFAKNYIVRFGISGLTDVQKKRLMELYGIVDRIWT